MKIAPATMLAAWAVGTAWLILYVVVEHSQDLEMLEDEPAMWIELVGVVVGLIAYFPVRKLFGAWLNKNAESK